MQSTQETMQKMHTYLTYIDRQRSQEQALVLEVVDNIIKDIQQLNRTYHQAVQDDTLREYAETVRSVQSEWINELHRLVHYQSDQASQAVNHILETLHQFAQSLAHHNLGYIQMSLPESVEQLVSQTVETQIPMLPDSDKQDAQHVTQ